MNLELPVLVIRGPRAFGKSDLVAEIRRERGIDDSRLIFGKDRPAAIDRLSSLKKTSAEFARGRSTDNYIVIDDVDRLLYGEPALFRHDHKDVAYDLFVLLSAADSSESRLRVILTTTRDPSLLAEPQSLISRFLTRDPLDLATLQDAQWEAIVTDTVCAITHRQRPGQFERTLSRELVELSGGHPALMAEGVNVVDALFGNEVEADTRKLRKDPEYVRHTIRAAMLYAGTPPIHRQLLRYLTSGNPTERQAMDTLLQELDRHPDHPFTPAVAEGNLLLEAGIVRQHPRLHGQFRIRQGVFPEFLRAFFRENLRAASDSSSPPLRPQIIARPLPGSKRGEIRYVNENGETRRVVLTPNSWIIATELLTATGTVVSFPRIKAALEHNSEISLSDKAVKTAVGRLKKELAEVFTAGGNVVYNVRGEGYRFNFEYYEVHYQPPGGL